MNHSINLLWAAALAAAAWLPGRSSAEPAPPAAAFQVLVFSKTIGYRHSSIPDGIAAIRKLGEENHFGVDATEDSEWFTAAKLAKYQVVVFMSTIGDVLNTAQETALQQWVEQGGGFAGVHAAIAGDIATEGGWPWYVDLCCTTFKNHSAIVPGVVLVEDHQHPSTAHLPAEWKRTDEWYNFTASPRGKGKIQVLASMDESTYQGGTMGKDHPIAWIQPIGKGRMWYTALGHTEVGFTEPLMVKHLLGGIQYAAGAKPAPAKAGS